MNKPISRNGWAELINAQLLPDFEIDRTYLIDGEEIVFKGYSPGGLLHFIWPTTLLPVKYNQVDPRSPLVDIDWASRAIAEGRLVGRSHVTASLPSPQFTPDEVRGIDPAAEYRLAVMRALDAISRRPKNYHIVQVLKSLAQIHPDLAKAFGIQPTVRTVMYWLKSRGEYGKRTYVDAMSMQGRVHRDRRLNPIVVDIIHEVGLLYYADPAMTKAEASLQVDEFVAREIEKRETEGIRLKGLRTPCRTTVGRILDSMACFDTFLERFGLRPARRFFRANGIGLRARRILELCVIDHTVLDCIAVDPESGTPIGRPILTVMLDVFSRCVLGWVISFEPASLYSALECLRRANLPKPDAPLAETFATLVHIYGKPMEIVCDNGLEFIGTSFRHSLNDLGVGVRFCPIKEPQYKGHGERFFGTLNSMGVHNLPGTTLNKQKRLLADIDPMKTASMSLHDLEALIARAISSYHIDEHSTLMQPPAAAWAESASKRSIDFFDDPRILEQMLGASERRKLTRKGIRLFDLNYCSPEVNGLLLDLVPQTLSTRNGPKEASIDVNIKYNPINLHAVQVWNDVRKAYVEITCTDPDYAEGLTKFHHERIKELVEQKGLAFSSVEQRRRAKLQLREERYARDPKLKREHRRAIERLREKPAVRNAIGPSTGQVSDLFNYVAQQPFADVRRDGGQLPVSKRRGGKKADQTRKRNKAAAAVETGLIEAIAVTAQPYTTSRYFGDDGLPFKSEN